MRRFLFVLMLIPSIAWCQQKANAPKPVVQQTKQVKWEYFVYKVNPTPRAYESEYMNGDFEDKEANFFNPDIAELDSLGSEGWELVDTYTEVYTLFPNFGQKGYHTGMKENVKVKNICFVFKRSYLGEPKPKPQLKENGIEVKPRSR